MVGEYFIDICLDACCGIEYNDIVTKNLFNDIHFILSKQKESITEYDKLEFVDKLDLTLYLVKYKILNKNFDMNCVIDRLSTGRFKELLPLLTNREILDNDKKENIIKTVSDKRKMVELLSGRDIMDELLRDIDSGNYDDDHSVIKKWENSVEHLYKNIMNIKKQDTLKEVSSLNLESDDLSPILEKIKITISEQDLVETGYEFLKKVLPTKGFERRRFYLIGGSSGVGKSTFLLNLIKNAVCSRKDKNSKRVYLYITAENLIDESWIRFYCCMTGTPQAVLLEELKKIYKKADEKLKEENGLEKYNQIISEHSKKLYEKISEILENNNSNVIFKYTQPRRTTIRDLEAIIETAKSEYGDSLISVYIDYLDLFSTGLDLDLRLEHAAVSQEFKNFSVTYNVALISATQLNRDGYDVKKNADLTQMGESMKKVDNADFILFLQKGKQEKVETTSYYTAETVSHKQITATILKNRNGNIGTKIDLYSQITAKMNTSENELFNYTIVENNGVKKEDDLNITDFDVNFEYGKESPIIDEDSNILDYSTPTENIEPKDGFFISEVEGGIINDKKRSDSFDIF